MAVNPAPFQATYQIVSPPAFDFVTPASWPRWIRRFERFRVASGLNLRPEDTQSHVTDCFSKIGKSYSVPKDIFDYVCSDPSNLGTFSCCLTKADIAGQSLLDSKNVREFYYQDAIEKAFRPPFCFADTYKELTNALGPDCASNSVTDAVSSSLIKCFDDENFIAEGIYASCDASGKTLTDGKGFIKYMCDSSTDPSKYYCCLLNFVVDDNTDLIDASLRSAKIQKCIDMLPKAGCSGDDYKELTDAIKPACRKLQDHFYPPDEPTDPDAVNLYKCFDDQGYLTKADTDRCSDTQTSSFAQADDFVEYFCDGNEPNYGTFYCCSLKNSQLSTSKLKDANARKDLIKKCLAPLQ